MSKLNISLLSHQSSNLIIIKAIFCKNLRRSLVWMTKAARMQWDRTAMLSWCICFWNWARVSDHQQRQRPGEKITGTDSPKFVIARDAMFNDFLMDGRRSFLAVANGNYFWANCLDSISKFTHECLRDASSRIPIKNFFYHPIIIIIGNKYI